MPPQHLVYDEHGVPAFDTTGMPYSKAKAKAYGKGPRAVFWPPYTAAQSSGYTRKYMFKFWKIEKRRRAIVMRENMARRTLIRANPQHGPFRPIDIHEDSQSDDEPTFSVAPAASMLQLLHGRRSNCRCSQDLVRSGSHVRA